MKIQANVLSLEDCGDRLKITAQGLAFGAADWQPWATFEMIVPMNSRSRRAYWIGRAFEIELTPT